MYDSQLPLPPPDLPPAVEDTPLARLLTLRDLPALQDLEREKWDEVQAATQCDMQARIDAHPHLSIGAFCPRTGKLLASLFLKPTAPDFWRYAATWQDCTSMPSPHRTTSLFGISLSSRDPAGVDAILRFFWPRALKGGWRDIYLGSPIPGLRDWLQRHPGGTAGEYVARKRGGLPADPQLRYYHQQGFKELVCVRPDYFPHDGSLDHGVILRGRVPLSSLTPVWRTLPLWSTQRVTRQLEVLL